MQISTHFSLEELTHSQTASRHNLANVPNAKAVGNLKRLCDTVLEPIRAALGPIIVDSAYRSPDVNHAVGGSSTSAHVFGLAADIYSPTLTRLELAMYCAAHVPFDQIILECVVPGKPNTGWVHIGLAEHELRRQMLTGRPGPDGKVHYIPGFQI